MKTFILSILLMMCIPLFAAEECDTSMGEELAMEHLDITTDVPKWLEGATITVKRADGQESTVSAEKFKVVSRKQQFIVSKTKQSTVTVCKAGSRKPNRVSLLGGYGSNGKLSSSTSGSKATVEQEFGPVGGIQYQRSLTERLSIGVQGQTNKNSSLILGLDF